VALAWLIRNPVVVAIPGASTVAQLESNVAAADINLTDEEYRTLTDESSRFAPVTGVAALPRLVRTRLGR
jgi:aryl-alcohol dehydrogenase-like predicted oxidoreductase